MKKTALTTIGMLACLAGSFAQETGFSQSDKLLNIGIGVNSYYDRGIPLGVSFETGVTGQISVGANVDYLSSNYDLSAGSKLKFRALYFGARASYHVNELLNLQNEKVDLYGGATLGYRSFSWSDTYSGGSLKGTYGNGVYLGIYIGGRYYFSNALGAFAELGAIGSTNARIGAALRF